MGMISRFFRILFSAVLFCSFLVLIGRFDDFLSSPIFTTALIGFYVKDSLIGLGLTSAMSWIVCIAIEAFLALGALWCIAWLYKKFKRNISTFKSN
jgi:hypothetical protein